MIEVNWLAVLVAGIVNMVVGFLWYGPLFGKKWMELSNISPEKAAEARAKGQSGMTKQYIITFIGSLVTAFVLYYFISYTFGFKQASGVAEGMWVGFWVWLGFVMPISMHAVLWGGTKSWKLWCLDVTHYLVALVLMSAVIAGWM